MSIFSASSYDSLPPATPSPRAPALPHSPSSGSLSMSTPPESLREYSSAMRARMTVAWAAALKDLKDDGYPSVASRRLDPEFGFDEDPIERHVRKFLSPNTKRREMEAKGLGIQVKVDLDVEIGGDGDASMRDDHRGDGSRSKGREEVMMDDIDDHAGQDVDVDVAFHPGLIDFGKPPPPGARLSRPPLPSWLSRTSTTTSLEPNTPGSGSTFSDASFEAASNEDYINMYGRDSDLEMQGQGHGQSGPIPGPSSLGRIKSISSRDRTSMASISTTTSTATFGSTITSLSTSTVTAAGSAVPVSVPVSISPIRPGLARPRPRVRPLRPHPFDGTPTKPSPRHVQEDDSGMEEWLDGRTVSETMVATAGLRCQTGRAMRGGR